LPPEGALFCLMGADSFFGLHRWHRAAEIPFVASLIVASRPGQRPEEWIRGLRTALPLGLTLEATTRAEPGGAAVEMRTYMLHNPAGESAPLYLLPGLQADISASQIRDQIREREDALSAAPESGGKLLPDAVFEYIRAHGLYG
jgi:nicotinate-nucleotide adenylyltransferase